MHVTVAQKKLPQDHVCIKDELAIRDSIAQLNGTTWQRSHEHLLSIGMVAVPYLVEAISGLSSRCPHFETVTAILRAQPSPVLLQLRDPAERHVVFEGTLGKLTEKQESKLDTTLRALVDTELTARIGVQPWQRDVDMEFNGKLFNLVGETPSSAMLEVLDQIATDDGRRLVTERITELVQFHSSQNVSSIERETISAQIRSLGSLLSPGFVESRRFWLRIAMAENIDLNTAEEQALQMNFLLEAQKIGGAGKSDVVAKTAVRLGLHGNFEFVLRFQAQGGNPEHLNKAGRDVKGCRASRAANLQAMPFSRTRLRIIHD